jgi:hypothetical protein
MKRMVISNSDCHRNLKLGTVNTENLLFFYIIQSQFSYVIKTVRVPQNSFLPQNVLLVTDLKQPLYHRGSEFKTPKPI